jgi:hypothetical protein
MASRFKIETIFTSRDMGIGKALDRQIRKQRKLLQLSKRQKAMQKANTQVLGGLTKGFAAAGVAAAGASVGIWKLTEAGRSFDAEMSKVRANMGDKGTVEGLAQLREEAARLGKTTMFTSAQAAAGMNELAKAGFTTEQMLGAINPVLSTSSQKPASQRSRCSEQSTRFFQALRLAKLRWPKQPGS